MMKRIKIRSAKALILQWVCMPFLLSFLLPAQADFFGPDNLQECASKYVSKSATVPIAREMMRACRIEFSALTQQYQKERARCQRKKLVKAKHNRTIAITRRQCVLTHPVTTAPPSGTTQYQSKLLQ